LGDLIRIEPELLALGYQIIAVSADRPEFLQQSQTKHKPNYLLLSDHTMQGAVALGIAWRVDTATLEKYRGFGIDLEKVSGETHHLLPVPTAYVLGTDGVIKFAYSHPDHRVRISGDLLVAAARAFLPAKP
jgi:peroxiredoxin